MPADGLTKALPRNKWQAFLNHLNLVERTDNGNHQEIALNELQEKLEQFTL
jgi:thioesterase domain-containing protein